MLTLRSAIDRVLQKISIAGGPDVQIYSDDVLQEMIQSAFDELFNQFVWEQFKQYGSSALDGTTGFIVDDLTTIARIDRFSDIIHVWLGNEEDPLPRPRIKGNPLNVRRPSIIPDSVNANKFKILPITTTGTINVLWKSRPLPFTDPASIINMDENVLLYRVAYDYLNGLGTNPAEETKFQNLYSTALGVALKNNDTQDAPLSDYAGYSSSGWQEIG